MSRPISWYLRRHPLLYKIRYQIVSKNSTLESIENFSYNDFNKKTNIPALFYEVNNLIFTNSKKDLNDFEKATTIAIWLKENVKGGPGLGKSSAIALQKMIDGEGGVCSDFSQVYSNFCVINDIKVKEWGMKSLSKDPKISGGHSFNEVYCPEFQKWIMIDIAKSILFYDTNKDIPLSTLEYIQLKKEGKEIVITTIGTKDPVENNNVKNIFLFSDSLPFIITNYDNKTIDLIIDKLDFLPESIIHGIIILSGKGYSYEFPKENP